MEAAQIARGIVRRLRQHSPEVEFEWRAWLPSPNLIETIALCHDLGHPPFGHGGEVALNYSMREAGGFEGNGQTLRLLARLEAHTDDFGLDLTRRSMLGVLKYPAPYEILVQKILPEPPSSLMQLRKDDWKPPKCFMATETDVVEWIKEPFSTDDRRKFGHLKTDPTNEKHGKTAFRALDTSVMEIADDIAYGVHDFEDAIALRMIHREDWDSITADLDEAWWSESSDLSTLETGNDLFGHSGSARKRAIGGLVNTFVQAVSVCELEGFEHPLLKFQAELDEKPKRLLDGLKKLVSRKVIKIPQVQTLEYRGQQLIVHLFEAFASDPGRLIKESFRPQALELNDAATVRRLVCDYIAGMTDEYATRMYERLFVPRHGQFSDRL